MVNSVLDASALLVLLKRERGSEKVLEALKQGAAMSSVNFSEVIAKLNEAGMPEKVIHETLDSIELDVIGFDTIHAYSAGLLRLLTKRVGLSFGDRACLALAQQLNIPALTADRLWDGILPDIKVLIIR
jgi:PIN domain nuclease of toxin-antitoxin system